MLLFSDYNIIIVIKYIINHNYDFTEKYINYERIIHLRSLY